MLPTFNQTQKKNKSPLAKEQLAILEQKNRKKLLYELPFKISAESEVIKAGSQNLTFFFSLCH